MISEMSEVVFGDDNDSGAATEHGASEVGGASITEKASKRVSDNRNKAIGEKQTHLAVQDLSKLDITKLTPLTPEVISRQATINIGTIGHVAHGKSTVVKSISGVQTIRFKNELVRNITIKLGNTNPLNHFCIHSLTYPYTNRLC